jgi:hypothetical protein
MYRPYLDYVVDPDAMTSEAEVCPVPTVSHPIISPWNGFQYQVP